MTVWMSFKERIAVSTTNPAGAPELSQTFGTEGLKTMERPSLVTRFFMRIVSFAEGST